MGEPRSAFGTIQALPQFRRNARRFAEVAALLAKYGLAGWLPHALPDFLRGRLKSSDGEVLADLTTEERIRHALTELGPAWVKLGQLLSTRPDIVGPALALELEKLQEHARADAPEAVRKTIESELGCGLEDCFARFEPVPLGSASIGQVHEAELPDGTKVAVKVQHAGIEEPVRADLEIMAALAELAQKHDSELARYQPVRLLREFRRSILAELDYGRERANAEAFVANFEDEDWVRFPRPLPALCSRRVLTMEFLDGISVARIEELKAKGLDTQEYAERGARIWIDMILRDGFFHADPHPGNLLVLSDGHLGVLDCGMTGTVDGPALEQFEDLVLALLSKDSEALTYELLRICTAPSDLDREGFRSDVSAFVGDYLRRSLTELDFTAAAVAAMEVVRRHRLVLPATLAQLLKTLVVLEGTSRRLQRDFNLLGLLEPYRTTIVRRRLAPRNLLRRAATTARDWDRLFRALPQDLLEILERIRGGTFDVNLKHHHLDSVANRIAHGLVTAALILGSAILLSQRVPPLVGGLSVFGLLGGALAALLVFHLLRAIRRRGGLG